MDHPRPLSARPCARGAQILRERQRGCVLLDRGLYERRRHEGDASYLAPSLWELEVVAHVLLVVHARAGLAQGSGSRTGRQDQTAALRSRTGRRPNTGTHAFVHTTLSGSRNALQLRTPMTTPERASRTRVASTSWRRSGQ